MKRIFTVDSNYLRKPELEDLTRDREGHLFIVPDLVMFEQAKSRNRELTLRESLRILSRIPDRVFIGRSVSALLAHELTTRKPRNDFAIFHPATPVMREILLAVRDGGTNEIFDEVLNDPDGHIPMLIDDHLMHADNQRRALDFQKQGFEPHFRPEFLSRLRVGDVEHGEQLIVAQHGAIQLCFQVLIQQYNFSQSQALDMINGRSVVMRYFFVKYWMALRLSIRAVIETRSAAQISNDNIDAHNAIVASQYGGFLTADNLADSASTVATQMANTGIRYGVINLDGAPIVTAFS
ncbi:hypothetical protein [Herbaspirillum robiniae]|uniref:hypothetical protein n=1 Tax=Herbaspirillum robiniae TaxID=2014887 RepID=UPI003D777B1A